MRKTEVERFWAKVEKDEGENACWNWIGCRVKTKYGLKYGLFQWKGRLRPAHCVSWEIENGPIPRGLWILHKCDNPPCIRPSHLFKGNHEANMADMVAKNRQARGSKVGYPSHRSHENRQMGEKHSFAKLTAEQAQQIPLLRQQSLSQYEIARHFGVSRSTVQQVLRGASWKSVVAVSGTGPDARFKLNEDQRRQIRQLLDAGQPRHEIAAHFGISCSTVGRC